MVKEEIVVAEVSHKPMIETLINTAAIALTTFGVANITQGGWIGYCSVAFGMVLEFAKYAGRGRLW